MSKFVTLVFLIISIAVAAFGARLALFAFTAPHPELQKPQTAQTAGGPQTVPLDSVDSERDVMEIHRGESNTEILRTLARMGSISDARQFNWLGRLTRSWKRIKAGEYRVNGAMTPMEIFAELTSGQSIAHPVTVREGENMYEIAADLESKRLATQAVFIELCKSPQLLASLGFKPEIKTLEGYLYPDTYYFNKTMSPQDMVTQMVRHANQIWTDKDTAAAQMMGLSRHQIIILASMIEKETGAPQERPMISSVFQNRLKMHMRLQSDPTTIYGMWDRYTGKIHRSDLLLPSPFNTYTVPALPEGPISNPGRDAIEAALHPSTSEYIFFVSHNDGTHQFSKSLTDHNAAVKKFQLDPKAREGKSWRDLNKKKTAPPPSIH